MDSLLWEELDPFSQVKRRLTYDPLGRVRTETDYYGRTGSYEYDTRHRVLRFWDHHHFSTFYTYDELSRVSSETRAGITHTYGYDQNGNRIQETDPKGHSRYSLYDSADRLRFEFAGLDTPSSYPADITVASTGLPTPLAPTLSGKLLGERTYDDLGRLASEKDEDGYITTFGYYLNDWVQRANFLDQIWQDPNGQNQHYWEEYAYNQAGVKTLLRRPNGSNTAELETVSVVNGQNQVEEIDHPDGRTERFGYTQENEPLWHADRDGLIEWYDYDDHHRITRHWRQVTSTLDPVHCTIETIPVDPDGSARGILLGVKSYNDAGDILTEADSFQAYLNKKVDYSYSGSANDPNSRSPVCLVGKTDPVGRNWIYTYLPNTDRVDQEMLMLGAGSGYANDPGNPHQFNIGEPPGYVGGQALVFAQYTYDAAGNVESVLDGDFRLRKFAYDELNRKIKEWRLAAGGVETQNDLIASWLYDGRGNITDETLYGINDVSSAQTSSEYDARGKKSSVSYPDNTSEEWDYDLADNCIRHQDPDGRIVRQVYDTFNRPEKEIQILAADSNYSAPSDRRVSTPDGSGILVSEKHYDQSSGDIDWEKNGRSTVISYGYDSYHRVIRKEIQYTFARSNGTNQSALAVWRYDYDALGNTAITIDPNCPTAPTGSTTVVEHDAEGRELRFLKVVGTPGDYPKNATIYGQEGFLFNQAEYDAAGRKYLEKDGKGIENRAAFDFLDRVKEESRAGAVTARYGYEAGGNKLWWTDGEGNLCRYAYDNLGYLITETGYPDPNNQNLSRILRTTHYDRQGNLLWEIDAGSPSSNRVEYLNNLRGRVQEQRVITDGGKLMVTAYTYDGAGNKTSETTPLLHTTRWIYDEFGRLDEVIAPDGGVTRYTYDPTGNLIRAEDAEYVLEVDGHFVVYSYDDLGRRMSVTRKAGPGRADIVEKYGYDGTGNILWQKDGQGRIVSYTYDPFSRLKTETRNLPDKAVAGHEYLVDVIHTYDKNGNIETTRETFKISQGSETTRLIHRVWDTFNRLESEDTDGTRISWTYDRDGRRLSLTYPDTRQMIRYEYDGLGDLKYAKHHTPEGVQQTEYVRYLNGLLHFLNHPNGTQEEWGYKQGTRDVTSLTVGDNGGTRIIRNITYTYDDEGNRKTETDIRPGQTTISRINFYDEAGRLREVHQGGQITVYTYDNLGNRLTEVVTDQGQKITDMITVFDGAGMLLNISGTKDRASYSASYTYDLAGNLIQRQENGITRTLSYDTAGRLVEVSEGGSQLARYVYNHEGRRIRVRESGGLIHEYLYDGRSLLEEYSSGTLERRYLYADHLIGLNTRDSVNQYTLHLDPLGSTIEVTDYTGTRTCSHAYDLWGETESTCGENQSKLLFTGHQFDEATGWYYFGARYYDPALARFLRPDPYAGDVTTPPSLHKYLYAYANPYRWVDMEGYTGEEVFIGHIYRFQIPLTRSTNIETWAYRVGQTKDFQKRLYNYPLEVRTGLKDPRSILEFEEAYAILGDALSSGRTYLSAIRQGMSVLEQNKMTSSAIELYGMETLHRIRAATPKNMGI